MANKWYSHSFRRNLVDMHIEDWNEKFLSEFDPDAYFACLKEGHIQSPMIYTHSHVGLCNWDSKSGRTHKAFQGNNKIKRLFDLCHQAGMDVVAYYSLIYNNRAYEDHPKWRMIDINGKPSRSGSGRYGLICPNNMGYRKFIKEQFAELTSVYEMEGVYLDMTFWPMVCYCDECRDRYRKETGMEIPSKVDWKDPEWICFQQARQRWIGEFAAFCTAELKKIRPELSVVHQFSTICQDWHFGVDHKISEASDYAAGDLYGGYLQQSYICKALREASNNQPFEYQTSRCDPNLLVHTTTKTLRALKLHNYLTLAHHGAFLVIDAIDPVGTMNPAVYRRIGEMFRESEPYERFLTGGMISEAALIMSYDSKFDQNAEPRDASSASRANPQIRAQLGMAKVLSDMRFLYTILPNNRLNRLKSISLAILTDDTILRDQDIDAIVKFVENGGKLYMSGSTEPKLAERLLGLVYKGVTAERYTYLSPTALGQKAFGDEYSKKYPLSFDGPQYIVENPSGHDVLATITLPYTNPSDNSQFASIHSNPPGIPTEYPAVIEGRYGKGKVLWVSAAIERNSQYSYGEITKRFVGILLQPNVLTSDAPRYVEMTLFHDPERRCYILHMVNTKDPAVEPAAESTVGNFIVSLKLPEKINVVRHAPDGEERSFSAINDEVKIPVEGLDLFATYLLEY